MSLVESLEVPFSQTHENGLFILLRQCVSEELERITPISVTMPVMHVTMIGSIKNRLPMLAFRPREAVSNRVTGYSLPGILDVNDQLINHIGDVRILKARVY